MEIGNLSDKQFKEMVIKIRWTKEKNAWTQWELQQTENTKK